MASLEKAHCVESGRVELCIKGHYSATASDHGWVLNSLGCSPQLCTPLPQATMNQLHCHIQSVYRIWFNISSETCVALDDGRSQDVTVVEEEPEIAPCCRTVLLLFRYWQVLLLWESHVLWHCNGHYVVLKEVTPASAIILAEVIMYILYQTPLTDAIEVALMLYVFSPNCYGCVPDLAQLIITWQQSIEHEQIP